MSRRRIAVVVTARPSYSRIRTALRAMRDSPHIDLKVIVAASALLDRYGAAVRDIEDDGFEVAARVYMVLEGENPAAMAKTTGLGLLELATVFDNLKPDAVVTIADRYETLATAVAASYMNIPVVHVQGGEVTGSIDEKVRHAVTKLADAHFVSSERAAERVIRMGEDPATVVVTGCPSIDLVVEMLEQPKLTADVFDKYGGVGERFDVDDDYLIVMQHPVTTVHRQARQQVEETLWAIAEQRMPTFWFWPNVDAGSDGTSAGIRVFREHHDPDHVHFFKNMAPLDFLRLVNRARCIIGNSSAGVRECSYLGVPAVNIGSRQAGRDRGPNVLDVDYDRHEIVAGIQYHLESGRYPRDELYGDGQAGVRIASRLADLPLSVEKQLTY